MPYWTFEWDFPQVHLLDSSFGFSVAVSEGRIGTREGTGRYAPAAFPNPLADKKGRFTPHIEGVSPYSIDREGDWAVLSDWAGIDKQGRLWCWKENIGAVFAWRESPSIAGFGYSSTGSDYTLGEKFSPKYRPRLLSDETGWTHVSSHMPNAILAIKGGQLYLFGWQEAAGVLYPLGDYYYTHADYVSRDWHKYRLKISSSVESISYTPIRTDFYLCSKKPSARIAYRLGSGEERPEDLGTGATVAIDWRGYVRNQDVVVSSGGSGYTSTPTVYLSPSSPEDEGKSQAAASVSMAAVTITGFTVTSPGSGYTAATATESLSGATASAIVSNGAITGWTLTGSGQSVPFASRQNSVVTVS